MHSELHMFAAALVSAHLTVLNSSFHWPGLLVFGFLSLAQATFPFKVSLWASYHFLISHSIFLCLSCFFSLCRCAVIPFLLSISLSPDPCSVPYLYWNNKMLQVLFWEMWAAVCVRFSWQLVEHTHQSQKICCRWVSFQIIAPHNVTLVKCVLLVRYDSQCC